MDDNAIYEMISSYALGCMDQRNFIQFKKYINSGGELPTGELGGLQNIIALIPTILEIDIPDPKLKDNVAKQLIKYQDEIKVKLQSQKERKSPDKENQKFELTDKQSPVKTELSSEIPIGKDDEVKTELKENPSVNDQLIGEEKKNDEEKLVSTKSELPRDHVFDETPLVKKSTTPWVLIILFILVVITGIVGVYFYQENSELNEKINYANQKLNNLQADLRKQTEFISQNRLLIDFLNKGDLEIVRLDPTDVASGAMGQLFLSFKSGEGILRITNLPQLEEGHIYQLWFVNKDETVPVLTIKYNPQTPIYVISSLPYIDKKEIELVRITDENDQNTPLPTGSTYLFGALAP